MKSTCSYVLLCTFLVGLVIQDSVGIGMSYWPSPTKRAIKDLDDGAINKVNRQV